MNENQIEELQKRVEALIASAPSNHQRRTVGGDDSALGESFQQWAYEHPSLAWFVRLFTSSAIIFAVVLGLWFTAGTGVGEATGLKSVRERVTNIYYALLWAARGSDEGQNQLITPQRNPGTIEQVIGDYLVVSYYEGGNQHRRLVRPANVITTDQKGFQEWANGYLLKGITFDFYIPLENVAGHEVWAAVLWYRRTPINVELVEQSLGYPEHNPPTPVVNQIFSQYYWNLAK